eukprot:CAMPEP_0115359452 /NCGR_PEP_ID=MMETSP0270-20121206/101179_1 /TAXON_ID=71861 /ORGANISM="Scrippsiella trochoidea, Strain CCMP3099" /LENGTH=88 /DNA_ID=CAMNT_0002781957 /DNA_START=68 /DNA_END=331 /DNA_ORIENTATION=-
MASASKNTGSVITFDKPQPLVHLLFWLEHAEPVLSCLQRPPLESLQLGVGLNTLVDAIIMPSCSFVLPKSLSSPWDCHAMTGTTPFIL